MHLDWFPRVKGNLFLIKLVVSFKLLCSMVCFGYTHVIEGKPSRVDHKSVD